MIDPSRWKSEMYTSCHCPIMYSQDADLIRPAFLTSSLCLRSRHTSSVLPAWPSSNVTRIDVSVGVIPVPTEDRIFHLPGALGHRNLVLPHVELFIYSNLYPLELAGIRVMRMSTLVVWWCIFWVTWGE